MAIEWDAKAYAKLMLHVARHPERAVNGYLVGSVASSGGEGQDSSGLITVHDTIPLFHTPTLACMLDSATGVVDAHGGEIVGYYEVNESVGDRSKSPAGERVASGVLQSTQMCVFVQVINARLADPQDHALQVTVRCVHVWCAVVMCACVCIYFCETS